MRDNLSDKGNHPLRLSIINLAIVKKYCKGNVEKMCDALKRLDFG
jgi:hypothetical protein